MVDTFDKNLKNRGPWYAELHIADYKTGIMEYGIDETLHWVKGKF